LVRRSAQEARYEPGGVLGAQEQQQQQQQAAGREAGDCTSASADPPAVSSTNTDPWTLSTGPTTTSTSF
jgi:hypothetical protein